MRQLLIAYSKAAFRERLLRIETGCHRILAADVGRGRDTVRTVIGEDDEDEVPVSGEAITSFTRGARIGSSSQ
jgi:hypothetical protein